MYILSRSDCFLYSRRVVVPRVSGKRLLLIESDLSMGPGFARQGSNLLSAPEKHHLFTSLLLVTRYLYSYHAQCLPCLSVEYLYLSLFVWIQGLIFFFYEKDLIRIKLASAIPVKLHSFIHSFIQAFEFLSLKMGIWKHRRRRRTRRGPNVRGRRKRNRKLSNVCN